MSNLSKIFLQNFVKFSSFIDSKIIHNIIISLDTCFKNYDHEIRSFTFIEMWNEYKKFNTF